MKKLLIALLFMGAGCTPAPPPYEIVLSGGRVMDPASGLDAVPKRRHQERPHLRGHGRRDRRRTRDRCQRPRRRPRLHRHARAPARRRALPDDGPRRGDIRARARGRHGRHRRMVRGARGRPVRQLRRQHRPHPGAHRGHERPVRLSPERPREERPRHRRADRRDGTPHPRGTRRRCGRRRVRHRLHARRELGRVRER